MSKIYCSLSKRKFKYKLLNFSLFPSLSSLFHFLPSLFSSLSLHLSSSPLSLSQSHCLSTYTHLSTIIWVSVTWRSLNYLHYLLYYIFNHRTKKVPKIVFEEEEPKGLLTHRTRYVEKETDCRDGHSDRTPAEGYLTRRLITHTELWRRSWKRPWDCRNPSRSP